MITINEEDLNCLKVSTYFSMVQQWIYPSLGNLLADTELKEREEKVKRKTPPDDKLTSEEARVAKRHCMDGSLHVERVIGAFMPVDLDFANSLFETELHVAVPLPFFLNKNLHVLIDEASTLPMIKSNPLPGESKGIYILDIEKLSACFGKELSIMCSQWGEAALNMFKFQQSWDKLGNTGEHTAWYDSHFNFFNVQQDQDELYEAWKGTELELHRDHHSQNLAFNAADHNAAFSRAKSEYKLCLEFQALVASSSSLGLKLPQTANRGDMKYTKFKPLGSHSNFTLQPFLSGSGRSSSSSSSSNCLICSKKGHTVFLHLDSPMPVKFLDGKPTWLKCTSHGLVMPNNRSLCINWNVRGDKAPQEFACTHRKDEHAHLCSFCSKQGHYALSWECHQPTSSH